MEFVKCGLKVIFNFVLFFLFKVDIFQVLGKDFKVFKEFVMVFEECLCFEILNKWFIFMDNGSNIVKLCKEGLKFIDVSVIGV